MQAADYESFRQLLDQLCATWDRPPAKDELLQAYWQALRDVNLHEVKRKVEEVLRTATGRAPFPKPGELRNQAPKADHVTSDGGWKAADARCIRNLEELRRADPKRWQFEVDLRRVDRILATADPGTSMYEIALRERNQLKDRAYE